MGCINIINLVYGSMIFLCMLQTKTKQKYFYFIYTEKMFKCKAFTFIFSITKYKKVNIYTLKKHSPVCNVSQGCRLWI